MSFETAFFPNKKTIFWGETSSILVIWSHNHTSSINVKTYHQLEFALNEPRYYSCLPHMLEPWNRLTKPQQPAKIKANTQTNKKKTLPLCRIPRSTWLSLLCFYHSVHTGACPGRMEKTDKALNCIINLNKWTPRTEHTVTDSGRDTARSVGKLKACIYSTITDEGTIWAADSHRHLSGKPEHSPA